MTTTIEVALTFPPKLKPFLEPARYHVAYGGRGAGKSVSICKILLFRGTQQPLRILCCREFQSSIADSVHQLLCDEIANMHLQYHYTIERDRIIGVNGTQFRFTGLKNNVASIKSYAHIDICFCEEAANISNESWEILIPSIRDGNTLKESEFYISFNPMYDSDSTWQRFVVNPPSNAQVIKLNFYDNPWFPDVLRMEMEELKLKDPDAFGNVYHGETRKYLAGAVLAEQIKAADAASRFTQVHYDPTQPVVTAWDLGYADATAIWIGQRCGTEIHLLDYIEATRQDLDHYLRILAHRPYAIDKFIMPHDARAHSIGTGLSIEEILRSKGKSVQVTPRVSTADGIQAVRMLFPTMYFDVTRCAKGLQALRNYRFETRRDPFGGFANEPVHDANSHAFDALQTLCLGLRKPKPQVETMHSDAPWGFHRFNSTSWMSI